MANHISQKRFVTMAVALGIAFGTVVCVHLLFFIYPSYRALCQSRQTILEQTAKLERLRLLTPVYTRSRQLDRGQFEYRLPFPRRVHIPRNELVSLSGKISDTAKRHHMVLSASDFDMDTLTNQSRSVSMVIILKGKLFDFRQFLIDIIGLESFNSIESLSIEANGGGMRKFTVNLGINVQKKRP